MVSDFRKLMFYLERRWEHKTKLENVSIYGYNTGGGQGRWAIKAGFLGKMNLELLLRRTMVVIHVWKHVG